VTLCGPGLASCSGCARGQPTPAPASAPRRRGRGPGVTAGAFPLRSPVGLLGARVGPNKRSSHIAAGHAPASAPTRGRPTAAGGPPRRRARG